MTSNAVLVDVRNDMVVKWVWALDLVVLLATVAVV